MVSVHTGKYDYRNERLERDVTCVFLIVLETNNDDRP